MYEVELKQLGIRARKIRECRGFSRSDLEKKSGVRRSQIYKIEEGKGNPTFLTLYKLALSLECDISTLVAIVPSNDRHNKIPNKNDAL